MSNNETTSDRKLYMSVELRGDERTRLLSIFDI